MLPIAILGSLTGALIIIAYVRGGTALPIEGGAEALRILSSVAPQLALGFLLAGMLTVLMPADLVSRWIGPGSGFAGILIATVAGALTPGGPYLQFPLVAMLANAGAGPGPMAAYLTAWSVSSVNRLLIWEIPVLGLPFAAARWGVSLMLPIIAGLAVPVALRAVGR
jgi:uncharacterized membrane protein YraQ (UPF0718 family)